MNRFTYSVLITPLPPPPGTILRVEEFRGLEFMCLLLCPPGPERQDSPTLVKHHVHIRTMGQLSLALQCPWNN